MWSLSLQPYVAAGCYGRLQIRDVPTFAIFAGCVRCLTAEVQLRHQIFVARLSPTLLESLTIDVAALEVAVAPIFTMPSTRALTPSASPQSTIFTERRSTSQNPVVFTYETVKARADGQYAHIFLRGQMEI